MPKFIVESGRHHRSEYRGGKLVKVVYKAGDIWEIDDIDLIDPVTRARLKPFDEPETSDNDHAGGYKINRVSPGWYNVVDVETDEVMNEKMLRFDKAEDLLAELMEGLDEGGQTEDTPRETEEESREEGESESEGEDEEDRDPAEGNEEEEARAKGPTRKRVYTQD